jgi:hypothetical protein
LHCLLSHRIGGNSEVLFFTHVIYHGIVENFESSVFSLT